MSSTKVQTEGDKGVSQRGSKSARKSEKMAIEKWGMSNQMMPNMFGTYEPGVAT